jgi:hypothetical protein
MRLYRVLVRFMAGHGWVLFLLRSHLTGDCLITRRGNRVEEAGSPEGVRSDEGYGDGEGHYGKKQRYG